MRKKHESSKSVGSRSHQPYSPFVFHARRPRVLFLLQSRDHEGMVLDMHPQYHTWAAIRRNDSPGDKFTKIREQSKARKRCNGRKTTNSHLPSWRWYFESCRESLIITLVITIPFIIRGRFDGWHYSKDKRASFSIRLGCWRRGSSSSSCISSEGGFKRPCSK